MSIRKEAFRMFGLFGVAVGGAPEPCGDDASRGRGKLDYASLCFEARVRASLALNLLGKAAAAPGKRSGVVA